jgi:hypothetical protein
MYHHTYFQDRLVADRRFELERAADEPVCDAAARTGTACGT